MERRGTGWWALVMLLWLASCGGDPAAQDGRNHAQDEQRRARAYMSQLKDILHELRVIQDEIGMAVTTDTVSAEVIVPLVRQRFRPKLVALRERAQALVPTPPITAVHHQLLAYLDQRIHTCDVLLRADSEQRPQLYAQFSRLQSEEERLGRELDNGVRQLRQQGY